MIVVEHGGPDGRGAIRHDFSTNANPLRPPPVLARALRDTDRRRYPDPSYTALRETLGRDHGVDPGRVLPTAGTSEAIRRLTLAAHLRGVRDAWVPCPGYADYAQAARALGLQVRAYDTADTLLHGLAATGTPALAWICEPCNPTGESLSTPAWQALHAASASSAGVLAIDRAYEPLRLAGTDPVPAAVADAAWQCWSPNKALGMTGIRAGYLVAPATEAARGVPQVQALAPSWVLSAEGVAMLAAFHCPETQAWLDDARAALRAWGRDQREALAALGFRQREAVVPFWLAAPPPDGRSLADRLAALRALGVKLRDTTSMGLAGWVRVSVQPPASQMALVKAWARVTHLER